jgi:hypothetical protein
MPVKPIPYGLADYKSLIEEGYAYVDKTMYIRTLEQAGIYNIFLRPRRFGKSLFASMLGYYYDIGERDNFDLLFSNTYIGQNPTKRKNTYYILQFNFSGIRTDSYEIMLESFTRNIHNTLLAFCAAYHLDITLEMSSPEAELFQLFTEFRARCDGKIYVIIDEYDKFANELLGSKPSMFEGIVSKDGFVRTWYEVLKRVSGTTVERIFITGVSPITLDSLTSGFNNAKNLSMRGPFNEMIGFTRTEVEQLIHETITEELPAGLMQTLAEYYNGYLFSEDGREHVFNSDMVLYYLDHYQQDHKPPRTLLDRNAVSDYGKLQRLITFQKPEQNLEILKEIVFNGYTTAKLIDSFSIGEEFKVEHFKSLLFYLGLLTIKSENFGFLRLEIPNAVMIGLYFDFLMGIITKGTGYIPDTKRIEQALYDLAYENSCELFTGLIEDFLHSLSNRDSMQFSEKEIKVAMAAYAGMSDLYFIKSEYEVEKKYIDLIFFPRDRSSGLDILLFELKYIKKKDESEGEIAKNLNEAVSQLKTYSSAQEFRGKKITCWAIVFVGETCVHQVKVS